MVRDDAVTLLLSRLGNRSAATWQTTIINEMILVQSSRLEGDASLRLWFLITENATSAFTIGDERLGLPTDFLGEVEEAVLQVLNPTTSKWVPLTKDDYDLIVEDFKDSANAIPEKYALLGDYFRVRPVPDLAYPVRMIYFGRDTTLATNIENDWLKHAADLVIAETGIVMAEQHIKDTELVASFRTASAEARVRLRVANEARKHTGRTYEMGSD